MLAKIIFYLFSAILLASAFGVISSKNSVKSVLLLVVCFIASAGLWLLLEVEFLAFALIVIYVGAVMVLFLFVIMMLDIDISIKRSRFVSYWPLASLVGVALIALLILLFTPQHFGIARFPIPPAEPASYSSIKTLGLALFTHYVYPFELAAFILLVAMIAAITLTFRGRKTGTKSQIIAKQVNVNPKDRVQLIDLGKKPTNTEKKLTQSKATKGKTINNAPRSKT